MNSTNPSSLEGSDRIRVGVLGATGLTGRELCKLLWAHPSFELGFAASRSHAGRVLDELDPAAPPVPLVHPDACAASDAGLVAVCLPHGSSGPTTERWLEAGARVIDLSGDFRLSDPAVHGATYGTKRSDRWASAAVYGLTERVRAKLGSATLVANPGCYPTSVALALMPLAEAGLLEGTLVVNSVSGVSGAGAKPTDVTHFCSVHGDVRPYKLGREHRHVVEMEQSLAASGSPTSVVFNPHLVPIERGILTTIALPGLELEPRRLRALYGDRYADEPFVRLLADGQCARIAAVAGTNDAAVSVQPLGDMPGCVVVCAIDNLLKGAAGQAIQNLNVMCGLPETLGLPSTHAPREEVALHAH